MIVRTLQDSDKSHRRIEDPNGNWNSVRLLLKEDKMGFSFHITTIYQGADFQMHYQNHLESVYCMSGNGEVENLNTGEVFPIKPGTIYILDKHDRHILRAFTEMKMACVFNPPLTGSEIHNSYGSYEIK
ncbi:MAG: ectoine synthase [Gammaproteobacteria bacterium]|nr:ectoine synthase [Gammaproteobacteria bacterium]